MIEKGENSRRLGEYVRSRRHAKFLSLAQAERRSGVDATYWSKLELGEYKSPNPRYLVAIAHALDLPVEELYGLAGYYLPGQLPSFAPYLRSRYHLSDPEVDELNRLFDRISAESQADHDRHGRAA
jgi:transcriptional regulator with XRE-family HTH domain